MVVRLLFISQVVLLGLSVSSSSVATLARNFRNCWHVIEGVDLTSRVFLITGAYSGLGEATTRALLTANAKVIATGRNTERLQEFATRLIDKACFDENLMDTSHAMDLCDLESVKKFARYVKTSYRRIDGLILNAGVMNTPIGVTKENFETQMGVNCLGHFLLAKTLAPITKRQVWVSSRAHSWRWPLIFDNRRAPRIDLSTIQHVNKESYNGLMRYQQSKLGNILLAKQFAARYPHMETASVSPGMVDTNIFRYSNPLALALFIAVKRVLRYQTPQQGCRTHVFCATTKI